MTSMTLPLVAKSFFILCKKCEADRYHKVLTHTSSTSAKIECEVCHSKKTYTLPKAGDSVAKKATTGKAKTTKSPRRSSHADEFNQLMMNRGTEQGVPFSIRTKFVKDQKIDHPKFGAGFVKSVLIDRVDVMFLDELKTLIHNKAAQTWNSSTPATTTEGNHHEHHAQPSPPGRSSLGTAPQGNRHFGFRNRIASWCVAPGHVGDSERSRRHQRRYGVAAGGRAGHERGNVGRDAVCLRSVAGQTEEATESEDPAQSSLRIFPTTASD